MKTTRLLAVALLGATLTLPAFAEKGGHGHGRDNGYENDDRGPGKRGGRDRDDRDDRDDHGRRDRRDDGRDDRARFDDRFRDIALSYYGDAGRRGNCPPGLAKKNNGCQPPGQARKWQRGYALPGDLRRYPLPADLLRRLPPPPRGHEYVRVAGDILLIAVGSSMVVDALEDLIR